MKLFIVVIMTVFLFTQTALADGNTAEGTTKIIDNFFKHQSAKMTDPKDKACMNSLGEYSVNSSKAVRSYFVDGSKSDALQYFAKAKKAILLIRIECKDQQSIDANKTANQYTEDIKSYEKLMKE